MIVPVFCEAPQFIRLVSLTLLAFLAIWCTLRASLSQDVVWIRQAVTRFTEPASNRKDHCRYDVQDVFGSLIWCALASVSHPAHVRFVHSLSLHVGISSLFATVRQLQARKVRTPAVIAGWPKISQANLPCLPASRWRRLNAQVTTVAINWQLVWRRPPAALGWAQIKRKLHYTEKEDWFGGDSLAVQER